MTYLKRSLNKYDSHADVSLRCKVEYSETAEWILDIIEEKVREGDRISPGDLMQIGRMSIRFAPTLDSCLGVAEPEFGTFPIKWIAGANNTIRHLIIQREVCDQVNLEPNFASMLRLGIISPNFFNEKTGLEFSRDTENGKDSGWVFYERGYTGSMGDFFSLYQIGITVPSVIPFLALPKGALVTVTADFIQISTPSATISSVENEFMQNLLQSAFIQKLRDL